MDLDLIDGSDAGRESEEAPRKAGHLEARVRQAQYLGGQPRKGAPWVRQAEGQGYR